jgi:hypothetical protein
LSADGTDSHGTNDLTNNNAVTFVAKGAGAPANMPANVANFVAASSQSFSRAAVTNPGTSFTVSQWFYANDLVVDRAIFAYGFSGNLRISLQAAIYFVLNGSFDYVLTTTDAWHHVLVWGDGVNAFINTDGGAAVSFAAALPAGNGTLYVGSNSSSWVHDGKISSPYLWSRVLTAGERTNLYASGNGLFY